MAKIRNTMHKNIYGDGYEQEITLDNGEQYTIRNTIVPNTYGDGYQKEIVKKGEKSNIDDGETGLSIILKIIGGLLVIVIIAKLCAGNIPLVCVYSILSLVFFIAGFTVQYKTLKGVLYLFGTIGGLIIGFILIFVVMIFILRCLIL